MNVAKIGYYYLRNVYLEPQTKIQIFDSSISEDIQHWKSHIWGSGQFDEKANSVGS